MTLPEHWFSRGVRLEIRSNDQVVTSEYGEPDKNWTYTDKNGHIHWAEENKATRVVLYPTLKLAMSEPYYCHSCRDEHDDSWYECRQCGEKIVPGMTPGPTTIVVPGVREAYLENVPMTPGQLANFNDAPERHYGASIRGGLDGRLTGTWERVDLTKDEAEEYLRELKTRKLRGGIQVRSSRFR